VVLSESRLWAAYTNEGSFPQGSVILQSCFVALAAADSSVSQLGTAVAGCVLPCEAFLDIILCG
jgi:hypothetical protein